MSFSLNVARKLETMIKYILDTSAVLALLFLENGHKNVEPLLSESAMSTVNVAEALTKLAQDKISLEASSKELFALNLRIIDFTTSQSIQVAELRPITKHLGLSLGDRACLALTMQENATAVTADRNWATVDFCRVRLIR